MCFIVSYSFLCIQDRKITGIKDEVAVIGTSRGLSPIQLLYIFFSGGVGGESGVRLKMIPIYTYMMRKCLNSFCCWSS